MFMFLLTSPESSLAIQSTKKSDLEFIDPYNFDDKIEFLRYL